nr:MAG TPA: hypothetical protein [Bacteriophage sp.]
MIYGFKIILFIAVLKQRVSFLLKPIGFKAIYI